MSFIWEYVKEQLADPEFRAEFEAGASRGRKPLFRQIE